ncbi:MAG TPA: hypothetical protein VFE46_14475 [Pirellulales bacterium]|jgi:hypothetical protein|nr:hypothetical protein [Pirellulales bacterium]
MLFPIFLGAILFASRAGATSIQVAATASGEFGIPESGAVPMVSAFTFTAAGQQVQLSANGTINLDPELTTGPNGISVPRSIIIGGLSQGQGYTPLEEGIMDGGGSVPTTDGSSTVTELGSLMGAFVPAASVSASGFSAIDSHLATGGKGINSTAIFFVGVGPLTVTAPGPGTLYLGIDESFVSNNTGHFSATVTVVPEPSALQLALLAGSFALAGATKKPAQRLRRQPLGLAK